MAHRYLLLLLLLLGSIVCLSCECSEGYTCQFQDENLKYLDGQWLSSMLRQWVDQRSFTLAFLQRHLFLCLRLAWFDQYLHFTVFLLFLSISAEGTKKKKSIRMGLAYWKPDVCSWLCKCSLWRARSTWETTEEMDQRDEEGDVLPEAWGSLMDLRQNLRKCRRASL